MSDLKTPEDGVAFQIKLMDMQAWFRLPLTLPLNPNPTPNPNPAPSQTFLENTFAS